jgi:hypothetical protein
MDGNGTATRLFHEIEFYDITTGKLDSWIQIPLLTSDVDFSLYIYYGNQNCTSQETTQGVWDENYLGVWHLDEKTGIPTDSTRYQNDAIDYEQQQDASGMIDGADGFDGLDDYIHVTSKTLDIPSSLTIEAWARMDYRLAADGWQRIYQKGSGKSGRIVELWIEDETQTMGRVVFRLNKKTSSSDYMVTYQIPGFSYGTWYHYTAVFDDGDNTLSLYINGEFKNSEIFNNQIFTGYKDNYIGNRNSNGDRPWNGVIDEVRISNIERSDSWIATNYNNQYFPSTFYIIDPEETGP